MEISDKVELEFGNLHQELVSICWISTRNLSRREGTHNHQPYKSCYQSQFSINLDENFRKKKDLRIFWEVIKETGIH